MEKVNFFRGKSKLSWFRSCRNSLRKYRMLERRSPKPTSNTLCLFAKLRRCQQSGSQKQRKSPFYLTTVSKFRKIIVELLPLRPEWLSSLTVFATCKLLQCRSLLTLLRLESRHRSAIRPRDKIWQRKLIFKAIIFLTSNLMKRLC